MVTSSVIFNHYYMLFIFNIHLKFIFTKVSKINSKPFKPTPKTKYLYCTWHFLFIVPLLPFSSSIWGVGWGRGGVGGDGGKKYKRWDIGKKHLTNFLYEVNNGKNFLPWNGTLSQQGMESWWLEGFSSHSKYAPLVSIWLPVRLTINTAEVRGITWNW